MPERKRFNEEIQERIDTFGKTLIKDIPELMGVGIALTYAQDLGEPEPQSYAYARDGDPRLICRMAMQSITLLGLHINNVVAAIQQVRASMSTEEENVKKDNIRTNGSEEKEADTTGSPSAN
jgi:hypothetical protein